MKYTIKYISPLLLAGLMYFSFNHLTCHVASAKGSSARLEKLPPSHQYIDDFFTHIVSHYMGY